MSLDSDIRPTGAVAEYLDDIAAEAAASAPSLDLAPLFARTAVVEEAGNLFDAQNFAETVLRAYRHGELIGQEPKRETPEH